jgi:hypothetical protein
MSLQHSEQSPQLRPGTSDTVSALLSAIGLLPLEIGTGD